MEVNNYTTDIQTRAFEYAGYGLLPEDFTVSAGITKTLVDQLLRQNVDEYDANNPYVVSRNADILLYRLFGRDSKNLQQLKNVSKAYFDHLFLQEKTPAYTEALTVTMKTLFNMKQFSRNNILSKIDFLLEGEADCGDSVAYLMSLGFPAETADRLFVQLAIRVPLFMTFLLVVLHLFIQNIPHIEHPPVLPDPVIPVPGEAPLATVRYATVDQFNVLQAQLAELLTLQRSSQASHRPVIPVIPPNRNPIVYNIDDDEDLQLNAAISQSARLAQQSELLQRGINTVNAGSTHSTVSLSTPVPVLEALALLRATFEVGRPDLLGGDLYLRIYGPVGLFLVNLFHVVHLFKRTEVKQHSSVNARIITALYNPEASTSYETAAMDFRSSDLFPTSIEQWKMWFTKEYNRSHQITIDYVRLPGKSVPATVGHYLSQYHDKMMQLFQVVLGGTDEKSVQSHPRHITLWWLLMIFHYNTWTRAVITKQLDLLILNFEMRWSLVYQSKVTDPSWCTLKDALLNLSYCCVRCNRIGSSSILCTTTDCVTVQHKSGRSSQPDTKGYFSALKLWKKNNKALIAPYKDLPASEKAAKETAAFKSSGAFKDLPSVMPTSSTSLRDVDDYSALQNLIQIPPVMKST